MAADSYKKVKVLVLGDSGKQLILVEVDVSILNVAIDNIAPYRRELY